MLVWDCPEVINEWVSIRGGGHAHKGACTALGYVKDQKLIAGLVFHDCNEVHCMVNIALDGGVFPAKLLKAGLRYTFSQLQLKRLTFIIKASNIPSINLVRKLGATHEATLRDADITGNLLIYALFPEDCKIWSRLNGQKLGLGARNT